MNEPEVFPCPICGSEEYGIIYKNKDHDIVGCDHCVTDVLWYDYEEEMRGRIDV